MGFIAPHIGQRTEVCAGRGSPHSLQKRLPLIFAVPHFGQLIMVPPIKNPRVARELAAPSSLCPA